MASITVELDEHTLARLASFGQPSVVLARIARVAADGVSRGPQQKTRELTDASLKAERRKADAKESGRAVFAQREITDEDLSGERAHADTTLVQQREANAQMVGSTLRANQEVVKEAAARERAEGSERELRSVAELREMFIGILGHDLRTPLSSIILGAAALQRGGRLDAQDAETAARIARASQRITRMITQLLDLTRARLGGGLTIERKRADMRQICRNVAEEFEAPIVQLDVEGDVTGRWDADRLAEVLSNLVGNAVQYRARETPVTIEARVDGPDVVVHVVNRGPPIPADVLPFIFEPFRRAAREEKSTTGNLGLGLYIAQQIVIAHGGALDVRSAGDTTTFTMRLPRELTS